MPNLYQSRDALDGRPAVSANHANDLTVVRGIIIPSAALAASDVLEGPRLAADHIVTDIILSTDKLDSNGSPTITLDCGFMSGLPGKNDNTRTVGADFLSASTVGQAGGSARPSILSAFRQSSVPYDRTIGVKVNAGPATGVAPVSATNGRGQWQPNTAYAVNDYVILADGRRLKCTTAGTSQSLTNPLGQTGYWQPPAFAPTAYNATVADGSVTWTMADFMIQIDVEFRFQRGGF